MTFWTPYPHLSNQLEQVQYIMTTAIHVKNPQTQAAILIYLRLVASGFALPISCYSLNSLTLNQIKELH